MDVDAVSFAELTHKELFLGGPYLGESLPFMKKLQVKGSIPTGTY